MPVMSYTRRKFTMTWSSRRGDGGGNQEDRTLAEEEIHHLQVRPQKTARRWAGGNRSLHRRERKGTRQKGEKERSTDTGPV